MTKRALISVSDKAGIVEFAQELKKLGWDIISTGGTKVVLDNAGVDTKIGRASCRERVCLYV